MLLFELHALKLCRIKINASTQGWKFIFNQIFDLWHHANHNSRWVIFIHRIKIFLCPAFTPVDWTRQTHHIIHSIKFRRPTLRGYKSLSALMNRLAHRKFHFLISPSSAHSHSTIISHHASLVHSHTPVTHRFYVYHGHSSIHHAHSTVIHHGF